MKQFFSTYKKFIGFLCSVNKRKAVLKWSFIFTLFILQSNDKFLIIFALCFNLEWFSSRNWSFIFALCFANINFLPHWNNQSCRNVRKSNNGSSHQWKWVQSKWIITKIWVKSEHEKENTLIAVNPQLSTIIQPFIRLP